MPRLSDILNSTFDDFQNLDSAVIRAQHENEQLKSQVLSVSRVRKGTLTQIFHLSLLYLNLKLIP